MLNINEDMTNEEKYDAISCGIDISYLVFLELEDEPLFETYLRQIDALDLIGDKLYKLYHYCCKEDKKIFFETMRLFRFGVFSKEEIHENLNKEEPVPFIDGSITYDLDDGIEKTITNVKKNLEYSFYIKASKPNVARFTLSFPISPYFLLIHIDYFQYTERNSISPNKDSWNLLSRKEINNKALIYSSYNISSS